MFSTGPRVPVPDCQRKYGLVTQNSLSPPSAAPFACLPRQDLLAAALLSPGCWGSSGDNLVASPQDQATHLHGHLISAQVTCFKRDEHVPVAFDETPPTPSPFANVAGRPFVSRHSEKRLDGGGTVLAPVLSGTDVQRPSPVLGPSDVLLASRAPPSPFVRVADLRRPFHQTHRTLDAAPVGSNVEPFPFGQHIPAINLWIFSRGGRSSSSHVF